MFRLSGEQPPDASSTKFKKGVPKMSDLLADKEAAKKAVVDYMEKKSKNKTKFYFNDFQKVFPDDKLRAIKKVINLLVQEEVLTYWSSGSTTMYGLKGAGKQAGAEGE